MGILPLLLELNSIEIVPGGHIRKDDFVAHLQSLTDLDGVHRGATETDLHAHRFFSVVHHFEDAHGAIGFSVDRTTNVEHVREALDFDGAFDAEVGARARGQRTIESNVHGDGAVDDGGIDARNFSGNYAVVGVDGGFLADKDILSLSLRDFELGLQVRRLGDASEGGALQNFLADFDVKLLQDAVNSRPDVELIELRFFQFVEGMLLVDFRLLNGELRLDGAFECFYFLDAQGHFVWPILPLALQRS